jgi:uncharacterized Tic20 family protein
MTESNVPPPPPDPSLPSSSADPSAPPPVGYAGPMTSTGYPGPYVGPPADQNAKTMGMLCHLLSLCGAVVPFGNLIGPIIIWQVKKAEHPFIDDQGKESVNFQILMTIALVISAALICVVVGIFLLPVVGIIALIFAIIGGVKANQGEAYRYPFNIRFIK